MLFNGVYIIYAPTNSSQSLIAETLCMSVVITYWLKQYKSKNRNVISTANRILSFVHVNVSAMIYNHHKSIFIYYKYVGRVDDLVVTKLTTSIT